jgi:TetR/AcrR family transcriptional regulator, mexJK operon transcriptional repressor
MSEVAAESAVRDDPKEMQLLEAAARAFLQHGYAGTSMDMVAQMAQASKTTLYTRFPSKEALFKATISAKCRSSGMHFSPDEFDGLPVEEALRRIGRRFVDLVWSPEAVRIHQVVTGEAPKFPEVARIFQEAAGERACEHMTQFFERRAASGELVAEEPRFLAEQFFTMLKGHTHHELCFGLCEPPPASERDALVRRSVRLFLQGAAAGR